MKKVAKSDATTAAHASNAAPKPSPAPAPIKKLSSMSIKNPSSAPIQPRSSSTSVKKGMTMKVRVPAGTLPNGQRLVIWHPSVVISDAEDGYVEVIYKGNYPRARTAVRIALDQVKTMSSIK